MSNKENIGNVLEFAKYKHFGQKRMDGSDYIEHPIRVSDIIVAHGMLDLKLIKISLLHDILEDTDATYDELIKIGVTDEEFEVIKILTKEKDYVIDTYIENIKNNETACIVKLADRIDNLRSALLPGVSNSFRRKYIKETQKYYLDLAKNTKFENSIKEALDNLIILKKNPWAQFLIKK